MERLFLLTIFAAAIGVIDYVSMKIPDALLAGLLLILIGIDFAHNAYGEFCASLISAFALFMLFSLIFRFIGGLGFGDVKYSAIIGYALGFRQALYACIAASLAGIVFFAALYIFTRGKRIIPKRKIKIPFGPFLSFGLIVFSFHEAAGLL